MTTKIKLTAEQGKAMESVEARLNTDCGGVFRSKESLLEYYSRFKSNALCGEREALNTLTLGELATALYVGYEVEHELDKELKLGQFVYIDGELYIVARLNMKYGLVSLVNGNAWSKAYETLGSVTYALKKDSQHWAINLVPKDQVKITVTK